jgi:hypothetical protein
MRTENFADLVVAVCLGEIDAELPHPAECMDLLSLNSPIATAQGYKSSRNRGFGYGINRGKT